MLSSVADRTAAHARTWTAFCARERAQLAPRRVHRSSRATAAILVPMPHPSERKRSSPRDGGRPTPPQDQSAIDVARGRSRRVGAGAAPRVTGALLAVSLMLTAAACGSGSSKKPAATATAPSAQVGGGVAPRAGGTPIPADEIPSCFLAGEPQSAPAGERTQLFSPPPPRPRPAPATPQPTPDVAAIAGRAGYPLYALNAPAAEFVPVQLRESTVPAPPGNAISLFAVQYRQPPAQGHGFAIVQSAPGQGAAPPRDDLDDALDAVRLHARLGGATSVPGDPLADPAAALMALGCPAHAALSVQIDGQQRRADLVSWPGAPEVLLLRIEAGATEVVVEASHLSRDALLALPPRLAALERSPALVATLQAEFGGTNAGQRRLAQPARATPSH